MYLIETSTCISILRNRLPRAVARLGELSADDLAVSSITAAELYHGAVRSGDSARELRRVQSFLEVVPVLDFGGEAALAYGVVRELLQRSGQIIGPFDMLIAGHALSAGATVVTHNTREFQRVPDLPVEDWGA